MYVPSMYIFYHVEFNVHTYSTCINYSYLLQEEDPVKC